MTDEIKKQFSDMAFELEEIRCNGMSSPARSAAKSLMKEIQTKWKALEKQAGCTVTEEEAIEW